jgi:hypothetical protein
MDFPVKTGPHLSNADEIQLERRHRKPSLSDVLDSDIYGLSKRDAS